jgi:hypothetical protein
MLRRHSNVFRQQGARRQSKTGVVGKGNGILNDFIKHLVLDIQSQVAGSAAIVCTVLETVSQVTYFKNMLVGNKILSPFEQRRGFNHSCAAHADASIPWNVSLHMTRWLHVEPLHACLVSEISMCHHAVNCRRELYFVLFQGRHQNELLAVTDCLYC